MHIVKTSEVERLRYALELIRDIGEVTVYAPGTPRDGLYKRHRFTEDGHRQCHEVAKKALMEIVDAP